jgi:hypothetical protein
VHGFTQRSALAPQSTNPVWRVRAVQQDVFVAGTTSKLDGHADGRSSRALSCAGHRNNAYPGAAVKSFSS